MESSSPSKRLKLPEREPPNFANVRPDGHVLAAILRRAGKPASAPPTVQISDYPPAPTAAADTNNHTIKEAAVCVQLIQSDSWVDKQGVAFLNQRRR